MPRLAISFFAVASIGWSQVVGGAISGTVHDATGALLPSANVIVRNLETGSERRLTTDDGGRYTAPSIAVGDYEVVAAKDGFASQQKTRIHLVVGQNVAVDFTLAVGEMRQVVTVEETAPTVSVST